MDDQLDNDLKKRMREVFDNYEDTTADEGWLQLREKFPAGQQRRRGFLWLWWGAAAVLLLFLGIGIGLWLNNGPIQQEKLSHKPTKQTQPENIAQAKKQKPDSVINKATPVIAKSKVNNHFSPLNEVAQFKLNDKVINNTVSAERGKTNMPVNAYQVYSISKTTVKNSAVVLPQNNDSVKNITTPQFAANVKGINNATIQTDTAKNKNATTITSKPPVKSIASMFADDKGSKEQKNEVKYKKLSFEVYAATYFNYAQGSNNQLNAGAGFTANIALNSNLTLVTGVFIGQNTLSYGNNVPIAATANAYAINTPEGVSASNSGANLMANNTRPIASLNNYDANLVGLDVPLNLKYKFSPQTNDTYVLAGFSSGTFINESYTYKYNYTSTASAFIQTNNKSFDNFYFAKTLNLAFGVGYPFGKNRLIIEPFLKYPLQGLGSQDIRFGSGGLNLKFNFQTSKK